MAALQEAMKAMAEGDKAEKKTSFFGKKTPDWEVARLNYESAATSFKAQKAYDLAVEAHVKAANAFKNLDSIYLAGRQLESAAQLCIEKLQRPQDGAQFYHQASDLFQAHGAADKATDVLEKAARAMEPVDANAAVEFYMEACTIWEGEDKQRSAPDTFNRAISFLMKCKRPIDAANLSVRLISILNKINNNLQAKRQCLATIIMVLTTTDSVEGTKRLSQVSATPGFNESEEGEIARNLVQAFEQLDNALLAETLRRHTIRMLDSETAKAALALRLPGGGGARQPPLPQQPTPAWGPPQQQQQQQPFPQQHQPYHANNAPPAGMAHGYQGGAGGGGFDDDEDGLC